MVTELRGRGGCNRVHLHIVFVLLYSVCHFVSDSSFFFCWVCGRLIMTSFICNNSFTYYYFGTSVRGRERKREGIRTASRMYHPKEKKK